MFDWQAWQQWLYVEGYVLISDRYFWGGVVTGLVLAWIF